MSRDSSDCPLCAGSGEVNITPIGAPDSEQGTYGCPLCIAAERDEAEDQHLRDQIAWHEQEAARIRRKLPPVPAPVVVVEVSGGCVYRVFTSKDSPVQVDDVIIRDLDNIEDGDDDPLDGHPLANPDTQLGLW